MWKVIRVQFSFLSIGFIFIRDFFYRNIVVIGIVLWWIILSFYFLFILFESISNFDLLYDLIKKIMNESLSLEPVKETVAETEISEVVMSEAQQKRWEAKCERYKRYKEVSIALHRELKNLRLFMAQFDIDARKLAESASASEVAEYVAKHRRYGEMVQYYYLFGSYERAVLEDATRYFAYEADPKTSWEVWDCTWAVRFLDKFEAWYFTFERMQDEFGIRDELKGFHKALEDFREATKPSSYIKEFRQLGRFWCIEGPLDLFDWYWDYAVFLIKFPVKVVDTTFGIFLQDWYSAYYGYERWLLIAHQNFVDFNPKILLDLEDSNRVKYIKTILFYSLEEWLKVHPETIDVIKQQSSIFYDFILKIRSWNPDELYPCSLIWNQDGVFMLCVNIGAGKDLGIFYWKNSVGESLNFEDFIKLTFEKAAACVSINSTVPSAFLADWVFADRVEDFNTKWHIYEVLVEINEDPWLTEYCQKLLQCNQWVYRFIANECYSDIPTSTVIEQWGGKLSWKRGLVREFICDFTDLVDPDLRRTYFAKDILPIEYQSRREDYFSSLGDKQKHLRETLDIVMLLPEREYWIEMKAWECVGAITDYRHEIAHLKEGEKSRLEFLRSGGYLSYSSAEEQCLDDVNRLRTYVNKTRITPTVSMLENEVNRPETNSWSIALSIFREFNPGDVIKFSADLKSSQVELFNKVNNLKLAIISIKTELNNLSEHWSVLEEQYLSSTKEGDDVKAVMAKDKITLLKENIQTIVSCVDLFKHISIENVLSKNRLDEILEKIELVIEIAESESIDITNLKNNKELILQLLESIKQKVVLLENALRLSNFLDMNRPTFVNAKNILNKEIYPLLNELNAELDSIEEIVHEVEKRISEQEWHWWYWFSLW